MALIDAVKNACERLAPLGWEALLRRHGLDITRANLAAELQRELAVDRSVSGFEDFALTGTRGIQPGTPAWRDSAVAIVAGIAAIGIGLFPMSPVARLHMVRKERHHGTHQRSEHPLP